MWSSTFVMRYIGYSITMSAPSRRQPSAAAVQACSSGLCMRSQASIPNLAESRPNDLSCSLNAPSFCSACSSGAMIGIQPSPSRAARVTTASEEPPNQIGIGRRTGIGTILTSETVKSTPERHEVVRVVRPKTTEYLDLFGLTRAARFPFHSEGFVLDVIPSHADAQPETPTAQEIHLGRLLSDDACLTLRCDQNSAGEPDGRGQKAKRDKGLVERNLFIGRAQ